MKTHPTDERWCKNDYISTVSIDKTSARPLHLVQVLALPPDDIIRLLKEPEESFERALLSPLKKSKFFNSSYNLQITKARVNFAHTILLSLVDIPQTLGSCSPPRLSTSLLVAE